MRKFAQATSQIKAIEAEIEQAHQQLLRQHENKLARLNEIRDEAVTNLQTFAEHHREDLFTPRKSMDLAHGTIGFRMGTPKVEKSKKKTWEIVMEELKAIDELFVRNVPTVNKELIIANRKNEATMAKLNNIGIDVVQDETFFVEAKVEDLVNA